MDSLMQSLLASKQVTAAISTQPMRGSVPKPEYKAHFLVPWSRAAAAIHVTMDRLSAPVYGSTKKDDFISIQGMAPPQTPTVLSVPQIAGSNIPLGGVQLP